MKGGEKQTMVSESKQGLFHCRGGRRRRAGGREGGKGKDMKWG